MTNENKHVIEDIDLVENKVSVEWDVENEAAVMEMAEEHGVQVEADGETAVVIGEEANVNAFVEEAGLTISEEKDMEDEEEEEEDEEEDDMKEAYQYNFKEDLDALIAANADSLSEDFQKSAATIFESAISARVSEEVERIEREYNESLDEELQSVHTAVVEKVDSYLDYVVEQWMSENELAVESGLRTEIAENFMQSLQNLFVENYIEVPESKADLVDGLAEQVISLEEKLDEATSDNMALAESVRGLTRDKMLSEACEGLSQTEAEKLTKLAEGVEFEGEESFGAKLGTLRESYFGGNKTATKQLNEGDELIIDNEEENKQLSEAMNRYSAAIARTKS